MHPSLKLQIAEPCQENWNQMTAQAQGRFCGSCQKTVIDFTNMSDGQLLEYFKNYNSNTCGRFENHQLDRVLITPPPTTKPSRYKWALAMLFSGFLFSSKAKAQIGKMRRVETCQQEPATQKKGEVSVSSVQKTTELRGRIVDETGVGIPYASVQVIGGSWGVSTDSLGYFTLVLKDSKPEKLLKFSSVGFLEQTKMVSLSDWDKEGLTIALSSLTNTGLAEVVVVLSGKMGGVSVCGSVTRRTRVLENIIAKKATLKLFPNPAKAGSLVKVQFTKAGNHDLRLVDLGGRIIMAQSKIPLKDIWYSLKVPVEIAAGQYFVQIIDAKGKQLAVEKLIVIH